MEEQFPAQQMDLVNSQLIATQQQLQHLSERYQDLAQGHVVLLQQVVQLQKFVKAHDGVMHRIMPFLHSVDAQRRNSRITGPYPNGTLTAERMPNDSIDDHPASPLQQASELLDEFNPDILQSKQLEQMSHDYHLRYDYSTPPDHGPGSASMAPQSDSAIGYQVGNDLDNMVYPIGQTNGIDPVNSEHINNIPYALPPHVPADPLQDVMQEGIPPNGDRKKSVAESVWGPTKPSILLVEDDKVCARIGAKFLQAFECGVEIAVSVKFLRSLQGLH
jgi:osomolarity two-component system response regulator SKN7